MQKDKLNNGRHEKLVQDGGNDKEQNDTNRANVTHADIHNKKLSYRRETARQLPTWREGGVRPSSPLPLRPLWLHPVSYTHLTLPTNREV